MVDFLRIATRTPKKDLVEVYPKFDTRESSDLMIRGSDFYAIWLEDENRWSTKESDVTNLIDRELDKFVETNRSLLGESVRVLYMWDSDSGVIDKWHKFVQKQRRDSFHPLDEKLIFSNTKAVKEDYSSKHLPYPLEETSTEAYDKLISTLYTPEERHKIEWSIGAVVSGHSKEVQKFLVLYGEGGSGKSTILKIVKKLFKGYTVAFSSKTLGQASNRFAMERFKSNPLVAIDNEGDLSRIEDNTRLNALVSHDEMVMEEKFKSQYESIFSTFLFIASNKPVKITDAKSGLLRRLIDVRPSGKKLPYREYVRLMKQVDFELGGIACKCREVYLEDPEYYDTYQPILMLEDTNDFYDFMLQNYFVFLENDGTTLKGAWELYKVYKDEAMLQYPMPYQTFKRELRNYFRDMEERAVGENGARLRNYYSGFRTEKFKVFNAKPKPVEESTWIELKEQESIFDNECALFPAQYASDSGNPRSAWANVKTILKDLDTSKLHWVYFPEDKKFHIVIDFDLKDEDGNKSLALNIKAALEFPPTYAELSKSGQGIHLHYIYRGNLDELSDIYKPGIEIKVFSGNSSLRRQLTKCNDLPIAEISSGLPKKEKKGAKDVVSIRKIRSSQGLIDQIERNLRKEIHSDTSSSMDMIKKILDDAYEEGFTYDVSPLRRKILEFAANSSNQSQRCMRVATELHYKSKDLEETEASMVIDDTIPIPATEETYDEYMKRPLCFYDTEVFSNLFVICFKTPGKDAYIGSYVNPTPEQVEEFVNTYRLIDFNGRHYDRHILWARMMGYSNKRLYDLSQAIITHDKKDKNRDCFFAPAYNAGYTDVFDYSSKKQSLKKWEIELANKGKLVRHQELGLEWDKPVPEELWEKVVEYCKNDVIALEATWDATQADFLAREILADLAGGTVNDTTNSLTQRIIFGNNKNPQNVFMYRDLSKPVLDLPKDMLDFLTDKFPEMMSHTFGEARSILPYFDGYEFNGFKSTYLGEEIGEGGRVYAEPGIYFNVPVEDVASMHPHSALAEYIFGPYTKNLYDLVYARVEIKHENWPVVEKMLDGKLKPYIKRVLDGELTSKDLAYALKIAINSIYGLTAASFANAFRDPRNKDNIVAKRGALFMTLLKHEVEKMGYKVVHIKTDSIKIALPGATQDILDFVVHMGERYGYTFEVEDWYERICLVNDAVYVAKERNGEWTATGAQFQVPYVFKTLFSHEELEFSDFCETKSVSKGDIYIDLNEGYPDVSELEKELDKAKTNFAKGKISDTTFQDICSRLEPEIAKGHNYMFVGRVGQFTPVKDGAGGGMLYRKVDGKYYTVTGTKGYKWLESEMVREMDKMDSIDISYYERLCDEAKATIEKFGPFEEFVSDNPRMEAFVRDDFMNIPDDAPDEIPF